MSEAKKDDAKEAKTQTEKLVSEYGAQDLGTYMDARVEEKVIRVAVWNESLKSYQPTPEGLELLNTPTLKERAKERDKEKAAAKAGTKAETPAPTPPMPPQPTPPPPPPPGTPTAR
jgi:hypothetical protein